MSARLSIENQIASAEMTVAEFEQAARELCDMGLAYEKGGRFYAVPGIQVYEVDDDTLIATIQTSRH